jgi:hypothetical protein
MTRRLLSHLLGTAACTALAACAALAAGCTGTPAGSSGPRAEIAAAQGEFAITNSKNAQAIFQARALSPGDARSGQVRLTNSGRRSGQLALFQSEVRDRPGAGGGLLSDKVLLAVRDVTNPGDPLTVFAGPLGVLDDRSLGSIAPGEKRDYSFTVRLPDGGTPPGPRTGDNAYLGSALSVRYIWRATAADAARPPTTPSKPSAPLGPSGAPRLSFTVRAGKLLRRGRLDVLARCDRPCRVSARAQLPRLRKRGKKLRTRRHATIITTPGKAKRIRLKVAKKTRRKLRARVARRGRVSLRVTVAVRPAAGGKVATSSRSVKLRRKRARAR